MLAGACRRTRRGRRAGGATCLSTSPIS
jgi:hypothetical protein